MTPMKVDMVTVALGSLRCARRGTGQGTGPALAGPWPGHRPVPGLGPESGHDQELRRKTGEGRHRVWARPAVPGSRPGRRCPAPRRCRRGHRSSSNTPNAGIPKAGPARSHSGRCRHRRYAASHPEQCPNRSVPPPSSGPHRGGRPVHARGGASIGARPGRIAIEGCRP